jgi:hypothetical protein
MRAVRGLRRVHEVQKRLVINRVNFGAGKYFFHAKDSSLLAV